MTPDELAAWNEKQQGLAPRITQEQIHAALEQARLERKQREFLGFPVEEGEGIIVRIDKYNLSVDGIRIPATPEQEQRIRSLSEEARVRFMAIMRGKMPEAFEPRPPEPRPPEPDVVEVVYDSGKTITRYSDGTERMSLTATPPNMLIASGGWCAPSEAIHDMGFTVEEVIAPPKMTPLEAIEQAALAYRNMGRA